jgi:O-antigen/teichoic acid export membrane protein
MDAKTAVATGDLEGSELDDADLRRKVSRGLGWKLLTVVVGQGTQSLIAILLARLLTPGDFGLAGMALVFSGLTGVFTDLAMGAALIQKRTLTEEDRSTVFWATVGSGLAVALVGVAAAPLVADFFHRSEVAPLFAVVCLGTALVALGQTQSALLTREMNFRSLEIRRIAATIFGSVLAVGLALAGFGPWAIVSQSVGSLAIGTLLLWQFSSWRPKLVFSKESLRTLGSFGVKTLGSRLLVYVNLNGDNLLIGKFVGSEGLGVYSVAYNVMLLPSTRVTAPLRDVFYAAFARLQNDPRRLGEVWLRVTRLTSALLVPAFLGLLVVAPDFVPVVLGPKWHAVVRVLQLLSIAGVAQSFQSLNGNVYQARGRPGLFLRFMLFSTTITFGGFVIGLHWGVVGVAASFAIARTIVLVANTIEMCRLIELGIRRTLFAYAEVIGIALVMAIVVFGARELFIGADVAAGLRLVVCSALGAAVYFAILMWRSPDLIAEVRTTLRSRAAQVRPEPADVR